MPTKKPPKTSAKPENADHAGENSHSDQEYTLLIERGIAEKLSPKSVGKVYFQLSRDMKEKKNYLRIDSNDGGGLHSREWIPLESIVSILAGQAGHPFKSTCLKSCMTGKSANNASFLAAILRSPEISLIKASEKSIFHHLLVDDFEKLSTALLKRSS